MYLVWNNYNFDMCCKVKSDISSSTIIYFMVFKYSATSHELSCYTAEWCLPYERINIKCDLLCFEIIIYNYHSTIIKFLLHIKKTQLFTYNLVHLGDLLS